MANETSCASAMSTNFVPLAFPGVVVVTSATSTSQQQQPPIVTFANCGSYQHQPSIHGIVPQGVPPMLRPGYTVTSATRMSHQQQFPIMTCAINTSYQQQVPIQGLLPQTGPPALLSGYPGVSIKPVLACSTPSIIHRKFQPVVGVQAHGGASVVPLGYTDVPVSDYVGYTLVPKDVLLNQKSNRTTPCVCSLPQNACRGSDPPVDRYLEHCTGSFRHQSPENSSVDSVQPNQFLFPGDLVRSRQYDQPGYPRGNYSGQVMNFAVQGKSRRTELDTVAHKNCLDTHLRQTKFSHHPLHQQHHNFDMRSRDEDRENHSGNNNPSHQHHYNFEMRPRDEDRANHSGNNNTSHPQSHPNHHHNTRNRSDVGSQRHTGRTQRGQRGGASRNFKRDQRGMKSNVQRTHSKDESYDVTNLERFFHTLAQASKNLNKNAK